MLTRFATIDLQSNHKNVCRKFAKTWKLRSRRECGSCRSRQELSNAYLVAKFGVDTANNDMKMSFSPTNECSSQTIQNFAKKEIMTFTDILRSEICAKVCIV